MSPLRCLQALENLWCPLPTNPDQGENPVQDSILPLRLPLHEDGGAEHWEEKTCPCEKHLEKRNTDFETKNAKPAIGSRHTGRSLSSGWLRTLSRAASSRCSFSSSSRVMIVTGWPVKDIAWKGRLKQLTFHVHSCSFFTLTPMEVKMKLLSLECEASQLASEKWHLPQRNDVTSLSWVRERVS